MVANPLKSQNHLHLGGAEHGRQGRGGIQKMEGYLAGLSIRAQPLRLSRAWYGSRPTSPSIPTSTHSRHAVRGYRNNGDPRWAMGQEGPILQKMIGRAKKGERRRWRHQCDVMVPRRERHRRNRVSSIRKIRIINAVGLIGIGL